MTATAILRELNKLPLTDKLLVIEQTLKSIRQHNDQSLADAVKALQQDYQNDSELTSFTQLDPEAFYEAR